MQDCEPWLRTVCNTPSGPYLRPFAPNTAWRKSSLFVIGTNPATPLRSEFDSFDQYWRGLTLTPEIFYEHYNRAHQGGETKSTRRTQRFIGLLRGVNTLVTKAYAYPAEEAKLIPDLPVQRRLGQEIFGHLVETARPAAMVFHGAPALDLAEWYFHASFDPYEPLLQQDNICQLPGTDREIRVFVCPHLSGRGVPKGFSVSGMYSELEALAGKLRLGLRGV